LGGGRRGRGSGGGRGRGTPGRDERASRARQGVSRQGGRSRRASRSPRARRSRRASGSPRAGRNRRAGRRAHRLSAGCVTLGAVRGPRAVVSSLAFGSPSTMKLLCTGDLHLGRRSSRLPSHLDGRTHSCAGCWDQVVALALEESVDVVALSGDLVDRDNRFYEAVGPLESGLRRLADAGIEIVAVAGNHDHDVLPRLVDALGPEAFRLLGRGGVWERATVRRGGRVLHIDGWSFPEPY